jgi:hypothetical protein
MKTFNEIISMILVIFGAIFLSYILFGCVFPDPEPINSESCPEAQSRLMYLGCYDLLEIPGDDQVVGTQDDPEWSKWCEWVQDSGIDTLDLECILGADMCEEVEECLN